MCSENDIPIDDKYAFSKLEIKTFIESGQDTSVEIRDKLFLLFGYTHLFSERSRPAYIHPLRTNLIDNEPVGAKLYPIPFSLREHFHQLFTRWLEWIVIVEQNSLYNNPVHVVFQADKQKIRPVRDIKYIKTKKLILRAQLEYLKDIRQYLCNSVLFSSGDTKAGYYSLPLHPDSYPGTAFIFERRQYCFRFLPMGLKSTLSCFNQR